MRSLLLAFYLTLPLITLFTLAFRFDTYENNRIKDTSSPLEELFYGYIMFLLVAWWPFLVLRKYFTKYIMRNKTLGSWVFVPILASLICFSIPDAFFLWVMAYDIMEMDFSHTQVLVAYQTAFAVVGPVVGLVFAIVGWYVAKFALKLRRRSD